MTLSQNRRLVGIGDINGDGRTDMAGVAVGVDNLANIYLGGQSGVPAVYSQHSLGSTSNAVYGLGDISSPLDGYDDYAIVTSTNGVAEKLQVYFGGMSTPAQNLTVARSGTISNVKAQITPTTGDFDGDGRVDLAVLETVVLNSTNAPILGQVYIFSNINSFVANRV